MRITTSMCCHHHVHIRRVPQRVLRVLCLQVVGNHTAVHNPVASVEVLGDRHRARGVDLQQPVQAAEL